MTKKSVLLSIIAIAAGFGLLMSGCNRDGNRVASRPVNSRNQVRPAEVLSASAYRPPVRAPQYQAPQYQQAPALAYAPNIRVVPIRDSVSQPVQAHPVRYVQPVPQPVVVHPTPELAMARASMPVPAYVAPAPTARQARPAPGPAPIPELEPARYIASAPRYHAPQPVMMTARPAQPNRQEVQSALAPLPQPAQSRPLPPQQGWVASPATAMRSGYAPY